jgi:hypothetical protein
MGRRGRSVEVLEGRGSRSMSNCSRWSSKRRDRRAVVEVYVVKLEEEPTHPTRLTGVGLAGLAESR